MNKLTKIYQFFSPSLILLVIIFLFFSCSLLLDDPPVWPDEALFADISLNLLHEHRLGTDLWKNMVDGVQDHAYWYPPLYYYLNAFWFKLLGFSIVNQRLLSVFFGAIVIVLFYFLTRKLLPKLYGSINKLLPLATGLLLAIDPNFLKATRIGRPEILVIALTFAAFLTYLIVLKEKNIPTKKKYFFLIGIFLGLSLITHLLAIGFVIAVSIFVVYSNKKRIFDFKNYYHYTAGLITPPLFWMIYIFPNYNFLIDQLRLVRLSRNNTIPWYINVYNFPYPDKINYIIYILVSLGFIIFTLKNRKPIYILLSLLLSFAWIFTTLGEIYWYTVYPVIFSYLALVILAYHSLNLSFKTPWKPLAILISLAAAIFLFYSNIHNFSNNINKYQDTNSYQSFKDQITKAIPPGKTVYLSSIPDAYYAFESGRNSLVEFPVLLADLEKHRKTLSEVDYIIFSNIYIAEPKGANYFNDYISKNIDSVTEISDPYPVLIMKLKEGTQRIDPN